MAAPQRKQPDRRKAPVKPARPLVVRVLTTLASSLVRPLAAHPRIAAGLATFAIVYSFVAANALWYQHGSHPSPLLATRALGPQSERKTALRTDETDVTTFRIERQGEDQQANPGARPVKPDPLVAEIQSELAARDLYVGKADGIMGPKTSAAIQFFEETEGLEPTGEPSTLVLKRLQARKPSQVAVLPAERPADQTGSVPKKQNDASSKDAPRGDDVANLILASGEGQQASPKADPLVLKIQKGLRKLAYDTVEPDGIAGNRTREAIRNFQKHYRLKVDGEPSQAVLDKLEMIGAL